MPETAVGVAPAEPVVLAANRTMVKLGGLGCFAAGVAAALISLFVEPVQPLIAVIGALFALVGLWILWRGFFAGDPLVLSREGLSTEGKPPIPWDDIDGLYLHRTATGGWGKGGLTLGVKFEKSCAWWQANSTPLLSMAAGASGYEIVVPLGPIPLQRASLIRVISANSPVQLHIVDN